MGGGSFFWEDPLGQYNHPSTIVGCFKVCSMGPPKKFCGSAGGSPAAHGRPKSLLLPKNGPKSTFLDKIRPGERGTHFSHVVSALKCSTMMFCNPKKFYVMFRRPPATYGKLKNGTFFQKWQKMKEKLTFFGGIL